MKSFSFGKNWFNFVSNLNIDSEEQSYISVKKLIDNIKISKGSFLDIGSGSGLFSLAALRLGFDVTSFDIDPFSNKATKKLKEIYFQNNDNWKLLEGSILDENFIKKKLNNKFDIVYSWGVLHHTGSMHKAIMNASNLVKQNGYLIISIYNDQGFLSDYWKIVKYYYNKNIFFKFLFIILHAPYFLFLLPLKKFFSKNSFDNRGMVIWNNYLDWIGGYPFEVAKPNEVEKFIEKFDFKLIYKNTVGKKLGCNEFIFKKIINIDG